MPFETDLVLRSKVGKKRYIVDYPLDYRRPNGELITVPAGFRTDLASVPRLFWRLLPRDGHDYRSAAVVHDYLIGQTSWSHAADVFSEALQDNGTGPLRRALMVGAVRLWGARRG